MAQEGLFASPNFWRHKTSFELDPHNSSELNSQDQAIESWYQSMGGAIDVAKNYVAESIKKLITGFVPVWDGINTAIVSLVSSVVNFLTNIVVGISCNMNNWLKGLLVASIISSFTTFIMHIKDLFKAFNFDVEAAKAAATSVASHLIEKASSILPKMRDPQPNAGLSPVQWIKIGIGSVVVVLFGGLGLSQKVKWKDLVLGSNVLEGMRKCYTNVSSVGDWFLKEIIGYESDDDYVACRDMDDLIDSGAELQDLPASTFIQSAVEYYRLRTFCKRIREVTTKPISQQASQRYMTVKALLIQMYKVLSDKLATVQIIMEATFRQVTTCALYSGGAGVGKSTLMEYVHDRVADITGYPKGTYCLNKRQDGFYGPYGGQAFGAINEFMARRDDDPNLPDFNLLASSDPMNLEGASLECKSQPWRGKLVTLTCNMDNPNLTGVLNEGAAMATWDRILHFRISDPKCEGRNRPNNHRKKDFSHLVIERLYHESLSSVVAEPCTLKDMINQLAGKCMEAEKRYLESVCDSEQCDEAMRGHLFTRRGELEHLLKIYNPHDTRTSKISAANVGSDIKFFPNAWGREFFVNRFQGTPGTGKTTLAEYVARESSQLFGLPMIICRDMSELIVKLIPEPAIYCFDDFVDDPNLFYDGLLSNMNKTHPKSMFLITTNHVIERCKTPISISSLAKYAMAYWQRSTVVQPWDCSERNVPQGLLRRCGLGGEIIGYGGSYLNNSELLNQTYTFSEGFRIKDSKDATMTREGVLERVFNHYRYFVNTPTDFMLTDGVPPVIEEPAVDIIATNAKKLIRTLKDKLAMMKAYMGRDPEIRMKIDKDYYLVSGTSPQTSFDMWYLSPDTGEDETSIRDIFTRMCGIFGKVMPRKALRIYLTDNRTSYYYAGGIGYIFSDAKVSTVAPIAVDGEVLKYFRSETDIITIPITDIIAYKDFKKFVGAFQTMSLPEVMQIDRWISAYLQSEDVNLYFKHKWLTCRREAAQAVDEHLNQLKNKVRTHPLFWVGCALVVLSVTGGAAYLVSTLLFGKKDEPREHDTWCDCSDCLADKYGQLDHIKVKDNREPRKFVAPPVQSNEGTFDFKRHTDKTVHKLSTIRRNARHERAIDEAIKLAPDIPPSVVKNRLEKYYNSNGGQSDPVLDILLDSDETAEMRVANTLKTEQVSDDIVSNSIKSNMLSREDMIQQEYPKLKPLHDSLTKCYYKVTSNEGWCYGIGLRGKLILTVGHMFEKVGEDCSITSDKIVYSSRCVVIDRDRDLAVVEVLDKTFPPCENTIKYFIMAERKELCPYSFYIKPGPDFEVIGGFSTYHPFSHPPIGKTDKFRFKGEVHVHVWIGLHRVRDALGRGECGFPLIAPDAGGAYRIIGIHNAYNSTEKVYFSSFTDEDHEYFSRLALEYITTNSTESHLEVVSVDQLSCNPRSQFLLPVEYVDALDDMLPELKFGHYSDQLEILGFSKKLCLRSHPKLKATFLDFKGMLTPIRKMPAAFTMEYVKDTSKLAITADGLPDPLFTQLLKYRVHQDYSFDSTILDESFDLVCDYLKITYGTCKLLRFHEVLNGKADGSLPAIDPSTSAGPFLKMKYGINNKYPLLDVAPNENKRVLILDRKSEPAMVIKSHYDDYVASLLSGGPPPLLISKDCAKVELLNKEKAEAGKVRLFNECDISINWVLKKFFGDLIGKVVKGHEEAFIRMGQNPYKTATSIHRQFRSIYGNVISTDFSGFDKQLSAELIFRFCRLVGNLYEIPGKTREEVMAIYEALAYTLVYALHTCRGTVVLTDRGNESGSTVTTLMNSILVLLITFYSIVKYFKEQLGFVPSLAEILRILMMAIFGDDRTVILDKSIKLGIDDFIRDAASFGLTCTPAKTSGVIDFCSRSFVWDERWNISWPELNVDSIYAMLRWIKTVEPDQVLDNIDNALFEAALHSDSKVWDVCFNDAKIIVEQLCLDIGKLRFHSRKFVRDRFIHYVRDDEQQACITLHAEREAIKERDYVKDVLTYRRAFTLEREQRISSKRRLPGSSDSLAQLDIPQVPHDSGDPSLHIRPLHRDPSWQLDRIHRRALHAFLKSAKAKIMPSVDTNPVSAVLELLAAARIGDRPVERCRDTSHDASPGSSQDSSVDSTPPCPKSSTPDFLFELELFGQCFRGRGRSKKVAKNEAYTKCFHGIQSEVEGIKRNNETLSTRAQRAADKHGKDFMYRSIRRHLDYANRTAQQTGFDVVVLHRDPPAGALQLDPTEDRDSDGQILRLSWTAQQLPYESMKAIYLMQPGTLDMGFKVVVTHRNG